MDDYKEKTKQSYNTNTEYHTKRFVGLFDVTKRTEFKKFIDLVPGKRILDLGCGGGENAHYFMQQGLDVLGIDISEKMVETTRQKGVLAEVMDIEEMSFKDHSFDGVWAVTSLLHLPKNHLFDVVKKIYSLLVDHGILYTCVKEGDGEGLVKDAVGNTERYFSYWQKDEFEKIFLPLFEAVEFKREKVGQRTFLMFFFRKK